MYSISDDNQTETRNFESATVEARLPMIRDASLGGAPVLKPVLPESFNKSRKGRIRTPNHKYTDLSFGNLSVRKKNRLVLKDDGSPTTSDGVSSGENDATEMLFNQFVQDIVSEMVVATSAPTPKIELGSKARRLFRQPKKLVQAQQMHTTLAVAEETVDPLFDESKHNHQKSEAAVLKTDVFSRGERRKVQSTQFSACQICNRVMHARSLQRHMQNVHVRSSTHHRGGSRFCAQPTFAARKRSSVSARITNRMRSSRDHQPVTKSGSTTSTNTCSRSKPRNGRSKGKEKTLHSPLLVEELIEKLAGSSSASVSHEQGQLTFGSVVLTKCCENRLGVMRRHILASMTDGRIAQPTLAPGTLPQREMMRLKKRSHFELREITKAEDALKDLATVRLTVGTKLRLLGTTRRRHVHK